MRCALATLCQTRFGFIGVSIFDVYCIVLVRGDICACMRCVPSVRLSELSRMKGILFVSHLLRETVDNCFELLMGRST